MISKRYKLINDIGGWAVFVIALVTYWLTLEPTASYWDCGEFIIQADKLEVGHPPGNPIFMLTARFFANFAPSQEYVAVAVNAMSGLLSALTILLLFWTISHLTRILIVRDKEKELSVAQYLAVMGSAAVGSLAYCWSDTFWFSAVEGEVYAFSSFCTALVFWLILKWENRAEEPHSDRYLILIAYVIGISVAVHLLNLLCIPAIVLVFVYRKYKDMDVLKSLGALFVSFIIIALVLFGLVPGIIKVAQWFELFFVNTAGLGFNSGAAIYALTLLASFAWTLYELQVQRSANMIRASFFISVVLSGVLFFGNGIWIGIFLLALLAAVLWVWYRRLLPVRVLNVIAWSMAMIFVGYSSYALILVRSSADTPMNQNSPDNVFDLASYLNREQYGENPLLYGRTLYSGVQKEFLGYSDDYGQDVDFPIYNPIYEDGKRTYGKGVAGVLPALDGYSINAAEDDYNHDAVKEGKDYYVIKRHEQLPKYNPELDMLFPRIYRGDMASYYEEWYDPADYDIVTLSAIDPETGNKVPEYSLSNAKDLDYNEYTKRYGPVNRKTAKKPSFTQNLSYFFNYQLNHMYMRYFMWNFAGRQNDLLNQHGEMDMGNWISGIPWIDNARLGDQSLLPDDLGKNNKGHNTFYMLPLLLGILGLLWQAFAGQKGIEQFWVVFFLFFMTGIAIVLYLNQPPMQPRERDYAFAGSFYAFAIWVGMGVAAVWKLLKWAINPKEQSEKVQLWCGVAACVLGLFVPVQMVSQTWDDHDRSGRYAARDYGINYLESLEENAIVFCNGDNDTFPLWYAQEVEGVRPDVRIINLSYLASDWYANQMQMQAYDSAPVPMTAQPKDYAYDRLSVVTIGMDGEPIDLVSALEKTYGSVLGNSPYLSIDNPVYIPVDKATVLARGVVAPKDSAAILDRIVMNLNDISRYSGRQGYLTQSEVLLLDIVATNAARGWERPIYICSTVGEEFTAGLTPYLRSTGMAQQFVPLYEQSPRVERAYDNIMERYRWGGADKATAKNAPYFDETATRMLTGVRSSMLEPAAQLVIEGDDIVESQPEEARLNYQKALNLVNLMEEKLPEHVRPYGYTIAQRAATILWELGQPERLNDKKLIERGLDIYSNLLQSWAQYISYHAMLQRKFGYTPSLSYMSQLIPVQFYPAYLEYSDMGGARDPIENALQEAGSSLAQVQQMYEHYQNYRQAQAQQMSAAEEAAGDAASDMQELVAYLQAANEVVVRLQGLTPEEYAKASEDDRYIDSIYYALVEELQSEGYEAVLEAMPELVDKVNLERSKRLYEEYKQRHPQDFQ